MAISVHNRGVNVAKIKAIMCGVTRDEWIAVNHGMETISLERGLHLYSDKLHKTFQSAINCLRTPRRFGA
jgi:hypothetical protein